MAALEAAGGGSGSEAGPLPGRCAFFVQRKRRFCKMIPAPGRRFCGEHGGAAVSYGCYSRSVLALTVYEDQLQKHLKKCNSREKPKPVKYIGVNEWSSVAE
uniref:tRNA:m(4)X modification enzyme TRM13 n=1 Tax=Pavo cristatus TaxID=9049 RepID=A0A8C9F936_PAVCR